MADYNENNQGNEELDLGGDVTTEEDLDRLVKGLMDSSDSEDDGFSLDNLDSLFNDDELNQMLNDNAVDNLISTDFADILDSDDLDDILKSFGGGESKSQANTDSGASDWLSTLLSDGDEQPEGDGEPDAPDAQPGLPEAQTIAGGLSFAVPGEISDSKEVLQPVQEESAAEPEAEPDPDSEPEPDSEPSVRDFDVDSFLRQMTQELNLDYLQEAAEGASEAAAAEEPSSFEELDNGEQENLLPSEPKDAEASREAFVLDILQEEEPAELEQESPQPEPPKPEEPETQLDVQLEDLDPQPVPTLVSEEPEEAVKRDMSFTVETAIPKELYEKQKLQQEPEKQKRQDTQRPKGYVGLGIFVTVLAVIGLIGVVVFGADFIKGFFDKSGEVKEWNNRVYPLVAIDTPAFETPDMLDKKAVISAGIWKFWMSDVDKSEFEVNEYGIMTVPAVKLEVYIRQIFGNQVEIVHQSLNDVEMQIQYDADARAYEIPANASISAAYKPVVQTVVAKNSEKSEYEVVVGYVMPSQFWTDEELIEKGEVDKLMTYTFTKKDGVYSVRSVQHGAAGESSTAGDGVSSEAEPDASQ